VQDLRWDLPTHMLALRDIRYHIQVFALSLLEGALPLALFSVLMELVAQLDFRFERHELGLLLVLLSV